MWPQPAYVHKNATTSLGFLLLNSQKKFAVKLRQRRIQLSKVVNNITQLINRLQPEFITFFYNGYHPLG